VGSPSVTRSGTGFPDDVAGVAEARGRRSSGEEQTVGNLHVALQDGFDNDTVEVRVDGLLVYQREAVTTMTQTSG
jgi:hypothetical protein